MGLQLAIKSAERARLLLDNCIELCSFIFNVQTIIYSGVGMLPYLYENLYGEAGESRYVAILLPPCLLSNQRSESSDSAD